MLTYLDSDIYTYFNKGNGLQNRMRQCLSKVGPDTIVNSKIDNTFTTMMRAYRESVVHKVVGAARKGRILIVRLPIDNSGDYRFPEIVPFIKVKRKGEECVIIDISRISPEEKAAPGTDAVVGYKVDIPKLYVLMVSAYISLELCGPNKAFPVEAAKHMATLFSKIYCQVLARMGMLTSDKERYQAFLYFAIEFYMTYYLNAPVPVVKAASSAFVGGHKNNLIIFMEEQISRKGIDPYKDFTTFSGILYDNELTGIRTQESRTNDINESVYVQKFMNMYSKNAIVALWAPEYFFYILLSAYRKTNVVFDRAFDDVFKDAPRMMPQLMDSLYKELG